MNYLTTFFRNKYLAKYPPEKIIEYVNCIAADIQKHIEKSIVDPEAKTVLDMSTLMSNICDNEKPNELPLVLKLKAESNLTPNALKTHGVNFS